MPMFHPSSRRNGQVLGLDDGGRLLDLETALKDGVLGGSCGASICDKSFSNKMDLKEMIEELEAIEVPSVFICPISLEPMTDPVTLCTGQTYERSNILKWLSLGHFTCPTTMQELWDDSITPNRTLYQLILTWFSQKYSAMKKKSDDVQGRVMELLETLKKVKGQARVQALKELRRLVSANASAKKTVVDNGGVGLISSLLGSFTSHAVGSESVGILVNLEIDSESKTNLIQPSKISLVVDILNEGSIETKINCTKFLELLIKDSDFRTETISRLSLLVGLLRLVKDKRYPTGILAGLRLLKTICGHEAVKNSFLSVGLVQTLVDLLPSLNTECSELALYVLESVSYLAEGKFCLRDCPNTISNIVPLLMRVSETCTRLAMSILLAICEIGPEEFASLAVDAGLAAKLLLVIQSGCNPALKQQSSALLKLCSLNYTPTLFISKCNLTRTIQ